MAGQSNTRLDFATIGGVVIALGGILGGLLLEGGRLHDVAQITAAIIVLGGTFGAVLISTPLKILKGASLQVRQVFFEKDLRPDQLIDKLIEYATKARKSGLVSLEQEAVQIEEPFLRKAINLAVDGIDMQDLRSMMELEIELEEARAMEGAKVFENAGGYSPTVGIIGAVMGLIQVMKNLANIEEVGHGIAVAFVATVYGVGLANLVLLPAASKIRARVRCQTELREMMLVGVIAIVEGINPKLIRSKIEAFLEPAQAVKKPGPARAGKLGKAVPATS